jgi:selenocysteine-specific elongation factor
MGVPGLPEPVAGDWVVDPARWARLRAQLQKTVTEFTVRDPLAPGMPIEAARAALGLPSRDLVAALLSAGPAAAPAPGSGRAEGAGPGGTAAGGAVLLEGGYLRLAGAPPSGALPSRVAGAVRQVLEGLAEDPFAAPDAQRLRELGLNARALATAARAGLLLRVTPEVVLAPGADEAAAGILAGLPQPFTMSQARQALGTSRRVAVPLLEHLDRIRLTERLPGDLRRVR